MAHRLGDILLLLTMSIGALWAARVLTLLTVPITLETFGASVVLTFWLRYLFVGARG